MDCPCGQALRVKTEKSIRTRESVDVRSCLCGKIREVVVYGRFDKAGSGHDKFTILAEAL